MNSIFKAGSKFTQAGGLQYLPYVSNIFFPNTSQLTEQKLILPSTSRLLLPASSKAKPLLLSAAPKLLVGRTLELLSLDSPHQPLPQSEAEALKRYNEAKPLDLVLKTLLEEPKIKTLVESVKAHPFLVGCSLNPELPENRALFRAYLLNDIWFLEELIKILYYIIENVPIPEGLTENDERAKIEKSYKVYRESLIKVAKEEFGATDEEILNLVPWDETMAYINWLWDVARGKDYYAFQVAISGCAIFWSTAAQDIVTNRKPIMEGYFAEFFLKPCSQQTIKWKIGEETFSMTFDKVPSRTAGRGSNLLDLLGYINKLSQDQLVEILGGGLQREGAFFDAPRKHTPKK